MMYILRLINVLIVLRPLRAICRSIFYSMILPSSHSLVRDSIIYDDDDGEPQVQEVLVAIPTGPPPSAGEAETDADPDTLSSATTEFPLDRDLDFSLPSTTSTLSLRGVETYILTLPPDSSLSASASARTWKTKCRCVQVDVTEVLDRSPRLISDVFKMSLWSSDSDLERGTRMAANRDRYFVCDGSRCPVPAVHSRQRHRKRDWEQNRAREWKRHRFRCRRTVFRETDRGPRSVAGSRASPGLLLAHGGDLVGVQGRQGGGFLCGSEAPLGLGGVSANPAAGY
ncbi:hypothetical protein BDW74DRAFT_155435 [Aspergillus multicolor]|uniref:uncharacterized protein n=1 Tax=Aspergillus multicolor TaxID=41759 RepID=UPI003CCD75FA